MIRDVLGVAVRIVSIVGGCFCLDFVGEKGEVIMLGELWGDNSRRMNG
jgi:hypothetical protein